MKQKKYSVTLIGLGNIGFLYDLDQYRKGFIKTHSKAIKKHPNFKLLCGIEINRKKANKFKEVYKLPVFSTFTRSLLNYLPDIVVIAVPSKQHKSIVQEVVENHKPKYILIEKPMGSSLNEAEYIYRLCNKERVKLAVNYPRVCDKDFMKIKKLIQKTKKYVTGEVFYTKGLLHNGSHFLNLMENYFGKVKQLKVIGRQSLNQKLKKQIKIRFNFANASIMFTPLNNSSKKANTIELLVDDKKIFFNKDSNIYINYLKSKDDIVITKTTQNKYQYLVYQELLNVIENRKSLICDDKKALDTFKNFKGLRI